MSMDSLSEARRDRFCKVLRRLSYLVEASAAVGELIDVLQVAAADAEESAETAELLTACLTDMSEDLRRMRIIERSWEAELRKGLGI
jgi:hypothetical protein